MYDFYTDSDSIPKKKLKEGIKGKKFKSDKAPIKKGKSIVKSKGKTPTKGKPLPKETAKSRKDRKLLR